MDFLTQTDFKAVCDDATLAVIHQADTENLDRAENYAIEEVSGYLRSRYDMGLAYAYRGEQRNAMLVMVTCDIALYHLVAWLPKRIGFEMRETRYSNALAWLKDVRDGKATPDLPVLTNAAGDDIGTPVRWGGWEKSQYVY